MTWILLVFACAPSSDLPAGEDPAGERFAFTFPVAEPDRIDQLIGVDHDPVDHELRLEQIICFDYLERAFPHCYDGHDGSDYLLDGGFDAMDADSPEVIAGADGVVVAVEDGHYDRCHGTIDGVDCDGNDGIANSVIVEHEGGLRSMYWHLKSGSTRVVVGDAVQRGQPLGNIGSSGNSSVPHLHFEVKGADGVPIDPYAGPASQPQSLWCDQGDEDGLPASTTGLGGGCP